VRFARLLLCLAMICRGDEITALWSPHLHGEFALATAC
jgi:hypothetical protein